MLMMNLKGIVLFWRRKIHLVPQHMKFERIRVGHRSQVIRFLIDFCCSHHMVDSTRIRLIKIRPADEAIQRHRTWQAHGWESGRLRFLFPTSKQRRWCAVSILWFRQIHLCTFVELADSLLWYRTILRCFMYQLFLSSREHIQASNPFMLATYASFVSALGMSFSAPDYAAGAISLVLFYRNMIRWTETALKERWWLHF